MSNCQSRETQPLSHINPILIFSLKDVKYRFYLLLNSFWVSENILVDWKKDQINNIQIG